MRLRKYVETIALVTALIAHSPARSQALEKGGGVVGATTQGPPIGETLAFLTRIIGSGTGKVMGHTGYSDYRTYSQSLVVADPVTCLISWNGSISAHYVDGTLPVTHDRIHANAIVSRDWLSLKYLLISEVRVVNLKTWSTDDRYKHVSEDTAENFEYKGYVLSFNHSNEIDSVPSSAIQNPNRLPQVYQQERLFFYSDDDARRAQQALVHAATLCGAKADPF